MIYLAIANFIPEFNDGRVKRIHALYDYLKENGFDCRTISLGPADNFSSDHFKFKSKFLKISTDSVKETSLGLSVLKKLSRLLFFPDRYIFASISLFIKLKRIITESDTLVISVPWFSFLILSFVRCKKIVDFRDLYVGNPIFSNLYFLDYVFFKLCLSRVDEIWVTTESAKSHIQQFIDSPVKIVRNGITSSQSFFIDDHYFQPEINPPVLNLSYFGNIGGKRDLSNICNHLSKFSKLELYGNISADSFSKYSKFYRGSLSWEEMVLKICKSHFVIVSISHEEHAEYAIPGKIYELIYIGVPLIIHTCVNSSVLSFLTKISYPYIFFDSQGDYFPSEQILRDFLNSNFESQRYLVLRDNEFKKAIEDFS